MNRSESQKDCPIYEEFYAIFCSPLKHILLIDDARCFNGKNYCPSTDEPSEIVSLKRSDSIIELENDIFRIELNEQVNKV